MGERENIKSKMHDTNVNELPHFHFIFFLNKLEINEMERQFNFEQINRIISRLLVDYYEIVFFQLLLIVT